MDLKSITGVLNLPRPSTTMVACQAAKLAAAAEQAVNDTAIRERANRLGEKIRAEEGVKNGIELIERFAGAHIP